MSTCPDWMSAMAALVSIWVGAPMFEMKARADEHEDHGKRDQKIGPRNFPQVHRLTVLRGPEAADHADRRSTYFRSVANP